MENIYTIHDLSFRYPKGERDVFSGVNLVLKPGQVLSVLGPNGAGKSTLLHCMAGLAVPQKGEILLDGKPLSTLSRAEIARLIGYVQQTHVPAFSYTVFQFVLMGRAPHVSFFGRPSTQDEEAVWQVLEQLDITHLANKPYTDISGGERQQCVIARAVVQQPRAILFDEPTAHLDYGNQIRILHLIQQMAQEGFAVVMTTHNPDHVLLLDDQVALLDCTGTLRYGNTKEILDEKTLQQMYHTGLRLIHVDELGRNACLHTGLNE